MGKKTPARTQTVKQAECPPCLGYGGTKCVHRACHSLSGTWVHVHFPNTQSCWAGPVRLLRRAFGFSQHEPSHRPSQDAETSGRQNSTM